MPRFRMSTYRWMGATAIIALALGFAVEWRRGADDRNRAGLARARAILAARQARRAPSPGMTDDQWLVLGIAATACVGSRLRKVLAPQHYH